MAEYRPPLFNFGSGSNATVFGIGVWGRQRQSWWQRVTIWPVYRVGNVIHRGIWWLRHRFDPKHRYNIIRTGLEPNYYDVDTLMLHGCFSLLCRYVEEEQGGVEKLEAWGRDLIGEPDENAPEGWQADQGHKEIEAAALYRWWKEKRPADLKRMEELTHILYSRPIVTEDVSGLDIKRYVPPEHTAEEIVLRDELWALEKSTAEEEQTMLHRLIDIRGGLWT